MKAFFLSVTIIGLGVFFSPGEILHIQSGVSPENLNWSLAIPLFLALYAVRPLIFFPDSIMLALGAVLFGPLVGWMLGYIGENTSASVAFWIGRKLGHATMKDTHQIFVKKLDAAVSRRGFMAILLLRQIPFMPFDLINYGAGLSGVSYRSYALATVFGIIPNLTVFVLAGGAFVRPALITPAALGLTLLVLITLAIRTWAPDIFELGVHHRRAGKTRTRRNYTRPAIFTKKNT